MPVSPQLDARPLSHTSIVPASSADEPSLLLPHDPALHSFDFDQLQRYPFDAVASVDVLEHTAREGGRFFVAECLGVARGGLVLTCLNGVDVVVAAEQLAAKAYQFRHGRPHPCLSEHDQCGLPQSEEVLSLLQEIGYPHTVFDNAPLDIWLPMMILSENLLERKALSECQHRLNQLFFASERNGESVPYRKVYIVAKEGLEDGGWK